MSEKVIYIASNASFLFYNAPKSLASGAPAQTPLAIGADLSEILGGGPGRPGHPGRSDRPAINDNLYIES